MIGDDMESVLTAPDSCWERAEDNAGVGCDKMKRRTMPCVSRDQGWHSVPGDQTRPLSLPVHTRMTKNIVRKSGNHNMEPDSHFIMTHTEIFIESKRFIWRGCISAERNDWHRSINKRLMNHCFFINFFWWSCRDKGSKQSKCILEKAETREMKVYVC